jgi:hypothetical protein
MAGVTKNKETRVEVFMDNQWMMSAQLCFSTHSNRRRCQIPAAYFFLLGRAGDYKNEISNPFKNIGLSIT